MALHETHQLAEHELAGHQLEARLGECAGRSRWHVAVLAGESGSMPTRSEVARACPDYRRRTRIDSVTSSAWQFKGLKCALSAPGCGSTVERRNWAICCCACLIAQQTGQPSCCEMGSRAMPRCRHGISGVRGPPAHPSESPADAVGDMPAGSPGSRLPAQSSQLTATSPCLASWLRTVKWQSR